MVRDTEEIILKAFGLWSKLDGCPWQAKAGEANQIWGK
jgi:hypothetical protein